MKKASNVKTSVLGLSTYGLLIIGHPIDWKDGLLLTLVTLLLDE